MPPSDLRRLPPPALLDTRRHTILIASPMMPKFFHGALSTRVAGHTETLLVLAKPAPSKDLVVRTIHGSSHRHKIHWWISQRAALPEHLVESELFRLTRRVPSSQRRRSSNPFCLNLADKSTIFLLDENGELQPSRQIQVKLLRVLDGAPYFRFWWADNRKSPSTCAGCRYHQNLDWRESSVFRIDLFHRSVSVQLRVPPLRNVPKISPHWRSLSCPESGGKVFY